MEYERYEDVIDAYNSGVGVEAGESLTDYIKRNNIKIKEIEMDPIGDFEKILKGSKPMEKEGIETEMIQLAGQTIRGCTACRTCFEKKNQRCVIDNDIVNECIAKMIEADGIILGSPVYFSDITAELKALIDRAGYVGRANGDLYKRKVGAVVIAVRRAGAIHAFDSVNHFFFII